MTVDISDLGSCDEHLLIASVCRDSFEQFIKEFWHCVPGVGKLVWNWHMSVFARELQEIAERVFLNLPRKHDLCTNVSPGTTKSLIYSVLFPAWLWTRMPSCRILTASYAQNLAIDLASKTRDVVMSELYMTCFPEVQLREDTKSKGHYKNTQGGERKICTVGGMSPLGWHAHAVIVDDPISPDEALSPACILDARNFMLVSIPNRKVDKAVTPIILVMQRLGLEDPTDVMVKQAERPGAIPVKRICIPAELDRNEDGSWSSDGVLPPELAENYINGLMDPVRLGRSVLDENKALGDLFYSTQFLQRPYSRTGGMFKESDFQNRERAAPYEARRVRYYDTAGTETGDYTVGTLMALDKDGVFWVEDVVRCRQEPYQRNQTIRNTALRDRARYGPKNEPVIYIERQGGSAGKGDFREIAKVLSGFIVKEQPIAGMGDKIHRAKPWSAQCAAGNVQLVNDGHWDINAFVEEHCAFPTVGHDDQVDSASGAFSVLTGMKKMPVMRTFQLRHRKSKSLRILLASQEELEMTAMDERTLLVHVVDPSHEAKSPKTAMPRLQESAILSFADLEPSTVQGWIKDDPEKKRKWEDPIEPWGKSVEELVFDKQQGKRMWSVLLKKRDPWALIWVFSGPADDNRVISLAYAVSDTLRLKRSETVFKLADEGWRADDKAIPPNKHVYDVARATRLMVI